MGRIAGFLRDFFSEDENYLPGAEPLKEGGRTYLPYTASLDKEAVWPNAYCGRCRRLSLKKSMYFDAGAGAFAHPSCLGEGTGGGSPR